MISPWMDTIRSLSIGYHMKKPGDFSSGGILTVLENTKKN
jgi:hypothetical protein